jgi:hypothetical protein
MGYGKVLPRELGLVLNEFLGLRHLEIVSRPLPWRIDRNAEKQWLREWRQREWHGWFAERVQFPFEAVVPTPPNGIPTLMTIRGLMPPTPSQAERLGVDFDGDDGREAAMVMGGTGVTPLDVTTANRLTFAEYQAYRAIVGPPPAMRGKPKFMEFGPGR